MELSRKAWILIGGAALALFAIYLFASPGSSSGEASSPAAAPRSSRPVAPAGSVSDAIEPIRVDWLQASSGIFESGRNLFAYVEPPPLPPPRPPAPPPPPPDSDGDGIPDFQDNCPDVANPDQRDIDRNGIGAACQDGTEVAPPPPPPTPPAFPYTFLGSFGRSPKPIAVFSKDGELLNVHEGERFGGKFILVGLGLESADIGYVGFPSDLRKRVPVGK